MGALSEAQKSTVVGYKLEKGSFNQVTPNLPQRIAILGQGNQAQESNYTENEIKEFISAQDVGNRYGFGSPLHLMMRILRPVNGTGVGGVPTIIIPQKEADSATKKEINIEPSGSASANTTHTLVVNGRRTLDGGRYDFVISSGDSADTIAQKMVDTLNNVLGAPVDASLDTTVSTNDSCLATTKWAGIDADELDIEVDTNGNAAGITYSVTENEAGAGVPGIQNALDKFGDEWNTIVLNPYGTNVHSTLENHNGKPSANSPTGRYSAITFKPYVALFGSKLADGSIDFSSQKDEVTNVVCPIPNSAAFNFEGAAGFGRLLANQAQSDPHLDLQGQKVPDVPVGETAGDFADYQFRNQKVKEGWSTVTINAGQYEIQDFVTTYHPDGEVPLQFAYVRNLMIDWNVRFRYYLLEQTNVVGHTILANGDVSDKRKIIKPKQWATILQNLADDLANDALIADPDFMKQNISVSISDTNPDRFETIFKYKRSGFARQSDTVAVAGFNLGN